MFLKVVSKELEIRQLNLLTKLEESYLKNQGKPRYLNEKCAVISVFLVVVIIFIGAGVQCQLENWTFLEGAYFYFITFTTIGFGDFIHGERHETLVHIIRPLITIIGLVVMSNVVKAVAKAWKL